MIRRRTKTTTSLPGTVGGFNLQFLSGGMD
jgi:hypothetical protein